jgi:hypothetical protein
MPPTVSGGVSNGADAAWQIPYLLIMGLRWVLECTPRSHQLRRASLHSMPPPHGSWAAAHYGLRYGLFPLPGISNDLEVVRLL